MADGRYDLVVIGGGPGGYEAAARAAELGLATACVERDDRLGGVCLREGCIPSKALLDASWKYAEVRSGLDAFGVRVDGAALDLGRMQARKAAVVDGLTGDVRKLLDRAGVKVIQGVARLNGPGKVAVETKDGDLALEARWVLLAAGGQPVEIPSAPFDGERIVPSARALEWDAVPGRLGVVGAGAIGLELGSVWARLGARVTVLEALPRIAPGLDGQVARTLERLLKRQGLDVRTRVRVVRAEAGADGVRVTVEPERGEPETLVFDRLLVAVGRRPSTAGLGLDTVGIAPDPRTGRIPVDAAYRTRADGVLAVGDLVDGPMLAHKASAEGVAAVENLAGIPAEVDYDAIPAVVYTHPEAAGVGLTEEQCTERGVAYKKASFPVAGLGRARCLGQTDGLVKLLAHERTDRVLGVHWLGPRASDLVAEAVLALALGASAEDLARTVHAHPTFPEALQTVARRL